MKKPDEFILICIIFGFITMLYVYTHEEQKVYYNCDLAEISPDIPLQVKQECRKLKRGN